MQLPYGTLINSYQGPKTLASVVENIIKEGLTGYLRVSIMSGDLVECVIVYLMGKPVMAFVIDSNGDKPDLRMATISASISREGAVIEVCKLMEKQVQLLKELYPNLIYVEPVIQQPPPPVVVTPSTASAPMKDRNLPANINTDQWAIAKSTPRLPVRFVMPEIRGRFVRSEVISSIKEYMARYREETGHLVLIADQDGVQEEYHIIIIHGKVEAVYNDRAIAPSMPDWIAGVGGQVEFYSVEPSVLTSVLSRYLRKDIVTVAPADRGPPAQPSTSRAPVPPVSVAQLPSISAEPAPEIRVVTVPAIIPPAVPAEVKRPSVPAPTIGIPARDLIKKSLPTTSVAVPAEEISKTVDEISKSMDNDIAMVRKVEEDFASGVEDLLEKLDLGHLKRQRKY
ncbi:MAG TPA: DUF2226 domain-containing protein [Methanocella sp.]|nr:DUF2226 domain-containing protein [Methanocella sp.]